MKQKIALVIFVPIIFVTGVLIVQHGIVLMNKDNLASVVASSFPSASSEWTRYAGNPIITKSQGGVISSIKTPLSSSGYFLTYPTSVQPGQFVTITYNYGSKTKATTDWFAILAPGAKWQNSSTVMQDWVWWNGKQGGVPSTLPPNSLSISLTIPSGLSKVEIVHYKFTATSGVYEEI